jgi:phosphoribosylanthranilate isomerase
VFEYQSDASNYWKNRMWIKICGNTNLEDARLAAELGADALGFIFAASKRQVTAKQVATIARGLPESVERVGVFDLQDAEEIVQISREARLNAVQLHGGYDELLIKKIAPLLTDGIRIIQTLHWKVDVPATDGAGAGAISDQIRAQLQRLAELGVTDRVLIDSKIGDSASGGTGIAFDWTAARSLFASASVDVHVIVAGGLKPENVAHAIAELSPFGVDVSSGVEAAVGRKDPAKLAQFLKNARTAAPSKLDAKRT